MMNRCFNFGAGPAMFPLEVLKDVQNELLNWQELGMSVLEIGHRSHEFILMMNDAETILRRLLTIPNTYHVLFLAGPARLQFGMLPLNLIQNGQQAGYLISGLWSSLAFDEATRIKPAYCIASSETNQFKTSPYPEDWMIYDNTSYLYYTPNETVNGLRTYPLKHTHIPIVADMTSCLLTEPINVHDYGLIFAGAQKNIANAGLTIVIIQDSWLHTIQNQSIPTMLDYRTHVLHQSRYATPPIFNCYLALKMLQWIERQGGVQTLYHLNRQKAERLYAFIDSSSHYECQVEEPHRSLLNICFRLKNSAFETLFIEQAAYHGLKALKGHASVGGLRASLYNSMPTEGVEHLIQFMDDFARSHDA